MKKKEDNEYISFNRTGWDEAAPVHGNKKFDDLKKSFENINYIYLNKIAYQIIQKIGVRGKSIVHLMCNNGRELVSLKRIGAGRCVGVDFSEKFLEQAHELASSTNLECEFVCCDVLAIPESLHGEFDIVFISSGSLRWIPDLKKLFDVICRLLTKGGNLLITEMHPVLNIYGDNKENSYNTGGSHSYFNNQPYENTTGLDYWQDQAYDSPPVYYFQHTLGEILSHCIFNRLGIRQFYEYPIDLSGGRYARAKEIKLPLSFSLVAQQT